MPPTASLRALRDRHLEYYLELAETYLGQKAAEAVHALAPHHDNLRSALRWALDSGRKQEALRMCVALTPAWLGWPRFREGLAFLQEALSQPGGDPGLRADVTYGTAQLFMELGRHDAAEEAYAEALAAYRSGGDERGAIRAEVGVVWSLFYRGRMSETAERLAPVLDRLDQIEDPIQRVRILEAQGWTAANLGDRDTARAALQRATAIAEATGDPVSIADHLGVKASALERILDFEEAEAARERAMELYLRHAPGSPGLAIDLTRLARLRDMRGDLDGAEAAARQALACLEGRDPAGEAWARLMIAGFRHTRGDLDGAHMMLVDAKESFERAPDLSADDRWGQSDVETALAEIAYHRGDVGEAERRLEHVYSGFAGVYDGVTAIPGAILLAAVRATNRGDARSAAAFWERLARTPPQPYEQDAEWDRARASAHAARARGDVDTARAGYLEVLEGARAASNERVVSQALVDLARLDLQTGDPISARERAEEALTVSRRILVRVAEATSLMVLATAHFAGGDMSALAARVAELRQLWRELADPSTRTEFAVLCAHVIEAEDPESAVALLAAATGTQRRLGYKPRLRDEATPALAARLRDALGERFDEIWSQNVEEPIQSALVRFA